MKQYSIILLMALAILFSQCSSEEKSPSISKIPINSPFAATAVKSEFFTINTKKDNVLEGKNGTLIVAPKGCFLDKNGQVITKDIKVELAEALTLEDMIMTGLSTMSDDKPLETDGMIYFYPTKDGEPVSINPDVPVYIEVPTKDKKSGMMAYKGVPNDTSGVINWTEPKELEDYLVNIDLALLDFLPKGFEKAVVKAMRKQKKTVDEAFIDSLYYSLSVMKASDLLEGLPPTDLNEPYYNQKSNVKDGKYQDGSFETGFRLNVAPRNDFRAVLTQEGDTTMCGIDPALIKVMKSAPYQKTFIATREFEKRMKLLHKNCQQSTVELYLRNLDLDLWEVDMIVSTEISDKRLSRAFRRLSKKKATNVQNANIYGKLLKEYYDKELKKIKNELEKNKKIYLKQLKKENKAAQKVIGNYKIILQKRENHRMEKYGYEWTNTGWMNIDKPAPIKKIAKILVPTLEVKVKNGNKYDQVYCYTIQQNIRSLYRLNPEDNTSFYAGNKSNKRVLMAEESNIALVVLGYKDEKPAISTKIFNTGTYFDGKKIIEKVKLKPTTKENVSTIINQYETSDTGNSIEEDLKLMKALAKERERQSGIKSEAEFIRALRKIAYSCCPSDDELGVYSF